MSNNSSIEWTEATWNPVTGCTRVSAGCDNCYAATMTARLDAMGQHKYVGLTTKNGKGELHFNGVVRTHDDTLAIPMRWKEPRRVFVNSMSDLFHRDVPFAFIDRVFAVMAVCPQHTFQVLTKRPERMSEYLTDRTAYPVSFMKWVLAMRRAHAAMNLPSNWGWPLPNVWLGTSVEDQNAADKRIPHLLKCPAAVRFLSCEPLLGLIDLRGKGHLGFNEFTGAGDVEHRGVDWVIVGGESGRGARQCDVAWIRFIVGQCNAASVPAFVKQLGAHVIDHGTTSATHFEPDECWPNGTRTVGHRVMLNDRKGGDKLEWPEDLRVRQMPRTYTEQQGGRTAVGSGRTACASP